MLPRLRLARLPQRCEELLQKSSFILLVFAWIVCFSGSSAAQISPGSLSRAHQSLNGTTQCTTCHAISAGKATFKCLDCHREIATRLAAGRGLHASYLGKTDSSQGCVKCHSEHNGEDFTLVRWTPTPAAFDHTKTGYPLEGKHVGLDCKRCHTAERVNATERPSIQVKDANRSYLGLSSQCASCHHDEHHGRLGPNCQSCHNFEDWKTTSTAFDHSKTKYPLTGAHVDVACQKCHIADAEGKPRYADLPFDRCAACHSDPHKGSFANSCQSCHSTSSWKAISLSNVSARFDHTKTQYPLLGKHREVSCEKCHASGDFKKPIAFQNCADCHKPSPHGDQFVKRADGGRCESCHNVNGFKPSTFGLKEHATTLYPLVGKHANVDCARCHIPAGRDTRFKIKFAQCLDCHHDMHEAQFAAAPYINRCEECHTVQGYLPSTFTLARHKSTRFQLAGAHIATTCSECHKPSDGGTGKFKTPQFRFQELSCDQCHRDPHNGQFKGRMLKRIQGKLSGCESCHNTADWKDVSTFDHSATDFLLTGSHRAVACAECHRPPNLGLKLASVDFHSAPTVCENCHEDVHARQFAKAGVTHCADCHNTNKWKPSLFDHSRTALPLEGVHKNVRCERCHTLFKTLQDKQVLFYRPTPKECAACHGAKT